MSFTCKRIRVRLPKYVLARDINSNLFLPSFQLVQRFCSSSLPFNHCHLSIEDFVYMHASIRLNIICFIADLFNVLEVKPFKPMMPLPGVARNQVIQVPDPGEILDVSLAAFMPSKLLHFLSLITALFNFVKRTNNLSSILPCQ